MASTTITTSKPVHRNLLSASFTYPLKGIYYFATHSQFYPFLGRRLFPLAAVSLLVLGTLFTFAYLPQVAFLYIFHGHFAWFNAVFLVLGEGQIVVALLFEALMVDETLVNVFDATLVNEGHPGLLTPFRMIDTTAPTAVRSLGRHTSAGVYSPFSLRQILEFILFLPLNLIPIIGTPAFLILTGARGGPFHHWRYFKLQGLRRKERKREIAKRKWKYTWFGTVALVLQLVPVLSMLFLLTTACGSALWVARLEEQKQTENRTVVESNESVVDVDTQRKIVVAREEYVDDVV